MKRFVKEAVLLLAAAQILTFSACSSAKSSANGGKAAYGADGSGISQQADNSGKSTAKSKTDGTDLSFASSRKILKTAELKITTDAYDKSISRLESMVESYGGIVQSSTTQGSGTSANRTAVYTVRIPSAKFSDFINSTGSIGSVVSKSVSGKDVTENYLDTQTRLSALRTEHSRLVELLNKADKMADILQIEDKIAETETQMEQYTGELKKWDSYVELSSVDIFITETDRGSAAVSSTFGGKLKGVFIQSVKIFVKVLKAICYAVVAALPFAAAVAIIAAVISRVRRRKKLKKAKISADGGKLQKKDDGGDEK